MGKHKISVKTNKKTIEDRNNVFDSLATHLTNLPADIQDAYETATIETVNDTFKILQRELITRSRSNTLNSKMYSTTPVYVEHKYYRVGVDWSDDLVNPSRSYTRTVVRKPGKRNYSLHPATYHDLAYIINYGHGGVAGNYFIKQSMRRIKGWESVRDKKFDLMLSEMDINKV